MLSMLVEPGLNNNNKLEIYLDKECIVNFIITNNDNKSLCARMTIVEFGDMVEFITRRQRHYDNGKYVEGLRKIKKEENE